MLHPWVRGGTPRRYGVSVRVRRMAGGGVSRGVPATPRHMPWGAPRLPLQGNRGTAGHPTTPGSPPYLGGLRGGPGLLGAAPGQALGPAAGGTYRAGAARPGAAANVCSIWERRAETSKYRHWQRARAARPRRAPAPRPSSPGTPRASRDLTRSVHVWGQGALPLQQSQGQGTRRSEVWGGLGHCCLSFPTGAAWPVSGVELEELRAKARAQHH